MKIRTGFVSNSSSSSFCLLGIIAPEDFDRDEFYEDRRIFGETLITVESGISDYSGQYIIGARPEKIEYYETLIHFKERICKELEKYGMDVKPEELKWITDGGFD